MSFGYRVKKFLNVITEKEVEKIHQATLEILNDVGLVITDDNSLQLLADAGCRVDFEKKIVKFPPDIVENRIKKCPSEYVMHARNPKYNLLSSSFIDTLKIVSYYLPLLPTYIL